MADDVAHVLGNMHLLVEEEEDIVILDDGRVFDIEGCTLSLIGMVEDVENCRSRNDHNLFLRVHVALLISKLLRRGGFLVALDGSRTWATFKYERHPMFCHYCGLLGHDLHHCALYFKRKRSGEAVNVRIAGVWDDAIVKNPSEGQRSEQEMSLIIAELMPKF
ncbi:hypothetical protein CFP56_022716 [Quercus suber]|uniref:Zinc knuckle CX2CX4HX4C domain-containing protein n=1 Tax=Quercus suber TaxID=58331 RepID=A0AAW0KCK4_QUESU